MKRILIFLLLSVSCNKNSSDLPPVPGKATLVFPAKNSACTTGNSVTDSSSSVTFTWNTPLHTESYELTVKNLLTRVTTTKVITTNQATDTLLLKTPYSWIIKSMSTTSATVTESDISKFYMSGPGESNYSPFPAALTSPTFNQVVSGGTINLTWTAEDIDNDIAGYDVYFGKTYTPPLYKDKINKMYLNSVPIISGKTYYWRIVTSDKLGNTATSDLYKFTTN
jgi:hypothetical protein